MAPDNRFFAEEAAFFSDEFASFTSFLGVSAFGGVFGGVFGDGRSVPGFHMLLGSFFSVVDRCTKLISLVGWG